MTAPKRPKHQHLAKEPDHPVEASGAPDEAQPAAHGHGPRRRRRQSTRWRRLLLWVILPLVMLAALFHRPILLSAIHEAAIRIAHRENVHLSLTVEGDLFTRLKLSKIHATGTGDSPVRKIDIESAEFHYNFLKLLRGGISDLLSSYKLKNATIELQAVTRTTTSTRQSELAKLLKDTLQQPALFSDNVEVDNLNLRLDTPEGPLIVRELGLHLDTARPGHLKAAEVTIPKIVTWNDLHTTTTFENRHLIVRDFSLGKEITVRKLELDASQRKKGIHYLAFEGELFGGDTGVFLWRRAGRRTARAYLTASIQNLKLEEIRNFLHLEPELSGTLSQFWVQMGGNPEMPSRWEGNALFELKKAKIEQARIDRTFFKLFVSKGLARLSDGEISTGANKLSLQWERSLPGSTRQLITSGLDASIALSAPALNEIHPALKDGQLQGNGRLQFRRGALVGDFNTTSRGFEAEFRGTTISLENGHSMLNASMELRRPFPHETRLHHLSVESQTDLDGLRINNAIIDGGRITASLKEGALRLENARFSRRENHALLQAESRLPYYGEQWADIPFTGTFDVQAPALADFNAVPIYEPTGKPPFNGSLIAKGELHRKEGKITGHGAIEASSLTFHAFSAQRFSVQLPIEDEVLRINSMELEVNGSGDKLSGHGSLSLNPPYPYNGRLAGDIRDLSRFSHLAGKELGGSLEIDWHGKGEITPMHHTGAGRLALSKATVGPVTGLNAEIEGEYSPESIELKTFRFQADQGGIGASIHLREQRLSLENVRVEVGDKIAIDGSLSFPFDLRTPGEPDTLFPREGAVQGKLTLHEIDLGTFHVSKEVLSGEKKRISPFKRKAPLGFKGVVGAILEAEGTAGAPKVTLRAHGRDLQSNAATAVKPARGEVAVTYEADTLSLGGAMLFPEIKPLQIKGSIPFPLQTLLEERALPPTTPLSFDLKLPSTSASFLPQLVPILRLMEGTMEVDTRLGGTLAKPKFSGSIKVASPAVRFRDPSIPGIDRFDANLRFEDDRLVLQKFQGSASGGHFGATGGILLHNLADPRLNLRFKSLGTLAIRNDSLILRTDADIRVVGPLQAAHVSGEVAIRKSRFFREIELIPIGVPGRPTPQPAASAPPQLSIPNPPLRDWTFDINVKTKEPLIVRSNFASGHVLTDLRLGGSGLAPSLEGTARVENFVASLPFSRLEVDRGAVYFKPDDPLNPSLDLHGTSRIRNHTINVYIYGTANDPQTLFTSEPPLPQEEIISLIATGATTAEFMQNDQALAGRATMLLLQDLYHKMVKRKRPPPSMDDNEPFTDRFSFDVGTVDPRTGRQEVGGRFQLTDQFELGAGLDVEGDVRVQVRYLLRFK